MKQIIKRVFSTLAVFAMVLGIFAGSGISAKAADDEYQIIIDNAVKGETYTAYKIFDVTYSGGATEAPTASPSATDIPGGPNTVHNNTAFAYTISSDSQWWTLLTTNDSTNWPTSTDSSGNITITNAGLKFEKTSTTSVYNVVPSDSTTGVTQTQAQALAAYIGANVSGKTSVASAKAGDTGTQWTNEVAKEEYTIGTLTLKVGGANGGPGYYFVDTTTGSLCSLDTTEPKATIREKNDVPSVDKTVSDSRNGTYNNNTDLDIGDIAYYKIVITDGTGTDAAITVHDTLSAGQTLIANSFKVLDGTEQNNAVATEKYTITYNNTLTPETDTTTFASERGYVSATKDDTTSPKITDNCTFEVKFTADYVKTLDDSGKVTITYAARLNESATIAGEGNSNKTHLTYSNQTSTEKETKVYTYAGAIYKVDGSDKTTATELEGVKFTVKIGNADAYFTKVQDGTDSTPAIYKYNSTNTASTSNVTNEVTTPKSGAIVFIGLDDGTSLTLTESHALDGYNKLASAVTVPVKKTSANTVDKKATTKGGATATFEASTYSGTTLTKSKDDGGYQINAESIIIVENLKGTVLPSTGGIGTTIFYVAGGILIVGAAALLISRRRRA